MINKTDKTSLIRAKILDAVRKSYCLGTICACTGLCHELKADAIIRLIQNTPEDDSEEQTAVIRECSIHGIKRFGDRKIFDGCGIHCTGRWPQHEYPEGYSPAMQGEQTAVSDEVALINKIAERLGDWPITVGAWFMADKVFKILRPYLAMPKQPVDLKAGEKAIAPHMYGFGSPDGAAKAVAAAWNLEIKR